MLKTLIAAATLAAGLVGPVALAEAGDMMMTNLPAPEKTGRVPSNGVDYHYAVYGEGEPLLLLHGGLGQIEMFGPNLATLAGSRTVIGVDLHGHGRTPLGARPEIDMAAIGDDMAAVLDALGYDRVDVLGYSFGGGVAFRLAAQHPERVRRLVIASAGFADDGYHPEMKPQQAAVGAGMAEMMKDTPMYRSYAAVAPDVSEFPKLLDAMGAMMRERYDWSDDVARLSMPVMLVYGDSDMFRLEHIVAFYQLLGGGLRDAGWMREHMAANRLAILPDLTHYELFLSPLLVSTALPFLDGKSNAPRWAAEVGGE